METEMLVEIDGKIPMVELAELQEWLALRDGRLIVERVYCFHEGSRTRYTASIEEKELAAFVESWREYIVN